MAPLSRSLALACLVLLPVPTLSAGAAGAGETADEPSPAEVASHHARGEVRHEEKWQTISRLLDTCREARKAEEQERRAVDAARARVAEINKTVVEKTAAYRSETKPLEREQAGAEAMRTKARRVLSMPPPRKPGMMKAMRGADGHVRRQIEEANRQREREYEQTLERYKELCKQAAEALKEAQETIVRCEGELQKRRAAFAADRKPFLTDRTRVTAELRRVQRQVSTLRAEVMTIAAVLRKAPEAVRLRFGAVEWKGEFYALADLRSMHGWMEATLEADRKTLEEKLAAEGRSLPKTWTHPNQAEADALKACIAGAEADREKVRRSAT